MLIEDVTIRNYRQPILLRLGDRATRPFEGAPYIGPGKFRNVIIRNIEALSVDTIPSVISGIPGYQIENILLENINIVNRGGHLGEAPPADSIPENPGSKPSYDMFGEDLPAKGFFVRHVNGITFNNVCYTELIPDNRPMFSWTDVQNITPMDTIAADPTNLETATCYNLSQSNGLNEETGSASFTIYPNPASSELTLKSDVTGVLQLVDLSGKLLLSQTIMKGDNSIDLLPVKKGMYIAVFVNPNGIMHHNLIKE